MRDLQRGRLDIPYFASRCLGINLHPGQMAWANACFAELFLWGRAQGYRWFNFGMTPLGGLDTLAQATLWGRVGSFVYRHAEHFYNFEGLRRYKAKFAPVWTPLYLASPGGLALAPVLVDVTALIAGGLGDIVSKRGERAA